MRFAGELEVATEVNSNVSALVIVELNARFSACKAAGDLVSRIRVGAITGPVRVKIVSVDGARDLLPGSIHVLVVDGYGMPVVESGIGRQASVRFTILDNPPIGEVRVGDRPVAGVWLTSTVSRDRVGRGAGLVGRAGEGRRQPDDQQRHARGDENPERRPTLRGL